MVSGFDGERTLSVQIVVGLLETDCHGLYHSPAKNSILLLIIVKLVAEEQI